MRSDPIPARNPRGGQRGAGPKKPAKLTPRAFLLTVCALAAALALIALTLLGRGASPLSSSGPRPVPPMESLAQRAAALLDRADYEGARRLYDQALKAAPGEASLWYGLGVALSRLDRREETVTAFQYVVQHGRPDSDEVRLARQWLVSAGVLAASVASTPAPEPEEVAPPAVVARSRDLTAGTAALKGKVTWGAPEPTLEVRILIHGLSGDAEGKRFTARAALGQAYQFDHLPAGSYRLIGRAADYLLWDLTVSVESGKEVVLDLGKGNSANPAAEL